MEPSPLRNCTAEFPDTQFPSLQKPTSANAERPTDSCYDYNRYGYFRQKGRDSFRSMAAAFFRIARGICPRYLAEFCYRSNRRFQLENMIPRLGYVAVRTPPLPYRLPKLAEAWG